MLFIEIEWNLLFEPPAIARMACATAGNNF